MLSPLKVSDCGGGGGLEGIVMGHPIQLFERTSVD